MKSKFKIFFSVLLLAVVIFAAVPKVYIHSLLGHTHISVKSDLSEDSFNEEENTKDCNFEKFDAQVYYTVFKVILNFLPIKEAKQTSFFYNKTSIQKEYYYISPLRGPPIA